MCWCISACLLLLTSLLPPADSEQEVPSGTTESAQSVDYYCDSKSVSPAGLGFSVLQPFCHVQRQLLQGVL